jgi:hypothetical protein
LERNRRLAGSGHKHCLLLVRLTPEITSPIDSLATISRTAQFTLYGIVNLHEAVAVFRCRRNDDLERSMTSQTGNYDIIRSSVPDFRWSIYVCSGRSYNCWDVTGVFLTGDLKTGGENGRFAPFSVM